MAGDGGTTQGKRPGKPKGNAARGPAPDASGAPHAPAPRVRQTHINVVNARTHNLKGVTVDIPLGRLTVVTGPSGSGKSSLAFDTLYAEGQRRFVESLSTYTRQFIQKMARPDVDHVGNIPPAIAIEQRNGVKNARSTIGTTTELADHLRLLFARAGVTVCPDCGTDVAEDSPQSAADHLLTHLPGRRLLILAPLALGGEVTGEALRTELMRAGFTRVFVDPADLGRADLVAAAGGGAGTGAVEDAPKKAVKGSKAAKTTPTAIAAAAGLSAGPPRVVSLEDASDPLLAAALSAATVRVVIDRVVPNPDDRDRLGSALATAFQAGKGTLEIALADPDQAPPGTGTRMLFHSGFRCNGCGRGFPRPEPNLFSFNNPLGACKTCSGFGRASGVDWEKVLPDTTRTLAQRPVAPFNTPAFRSNYGWLAKSCEKLGVPSDVPIARFTPQQLEHLKYGQGRTEGIQAFFDDLEKERYKVQSRILVARYRGFTECPACRGSRLGPDARAVWWAPADGTMPRVTLPDLCRMAIDDLHTALGAVTLTADETARIGRVWTEVMSRLSYLSRVGLGYLDLNRQTRTLSGGEAQRIALGTALGTALTRTLYVLDEPTVGLHPRDSRRLLEILRALRDRGNTVVVVEHDPELILGADHVLDIGPHAGSRGGELLYAGPPDGIPADTLTGKYLVGEASRPPAKNQPGKAKGPKAGKMPAPQATSTFPDGPALRILNARGHNLKGVDVAIPLHRWVCVTGVSGSGKSTLVHNVLYQAFNARAGRDVEDPAPVDAVDGLDLLDEILLVDQTPIGRSARSNPVTYVKAWDAIRKLMAATREAKALGLAEGAFSFNVKGGRCEACEGTGVTTFDMHFLAEVTLPCEACGGKRFTARALQPRWRGKNVDDMLGMTVDDAAEFFAGENPVLRRLAPLRDTGLGYLTLGQSTATLSGGEAQRLKLASHLSTGGPGGGAGARRTMMIFDEPTTGLALSDLAVLSGVFRRLVDEGHSLVVIEHNLEIIRQADWVIDLGPEAGAGGGRVVDEGTPADLARRAAGHTGRFLAEG